MIEFKRILYFDVHRTGSTLVISALRQLCDSAEVRLWRHNPISRAGYWVRPRGRLTFATVRNPWDWYVSLWAHGCDGHSAVLRAFREKLPQAEIDAFYDAANPAESFRKWMAAIHNPQFADQYLQENYPLSGMSAFAGLYTYRFLRVTTAFPWLLLRRRWIQSPENLSTFYHRNKVPQMVLHTETLGAELIELVRVHGARCGFVANADEVVRKVASTRRNASKRTLAHYRDYYDHATRQLVQDRDRLFVDEFGYQF